MSSGVYTITNKANGKIYVGSSSNIEKRWKTHLNSLQKGMHHNCKLQNDYVKYSENYFELNILEETTNNLKTKEDQYIAKLNSKETGYNIADANFGDTLTYHPDREGRIARMTLKLHQTINLMSAQERKDTYGKIGSSNSNYNETLIHNCIHCGAKLSHSTINRRGNNCNDCRDRTGIKNPFYGKKHSDETKAKLSAASKGKRRTSMPIYADGNIFDAAIDCAAHYNISASLVTYRLNSPKYPLWVRVNAERPSKG